MKKITTLVLAIVGAWMVSQAQTQFELHGGNHSTFATEDNDGVFIGTHYTNFLSPATLSAWCIGDKNNNIGLRVMKTNAGSDWDVVAPHLAVSTMRVKEGLNFEYRNPFVIDRYGYAGFNLEEDKTEAQSMVDIRLAEKELDNKHPFYIYSRPTKSETLYPFFKVTKAGRVGIGSNEPEARLHIDNNDQVSGTQEIIRAVNSYGNLAMNLTNGSCMGVGRSGGGARLSLENQGGMDANLDLHSHNTTGWFNQVRFLQNGSVRHVITDDESGSLVIAPGLGGGAIGRVHTGGELHVGGQAVVGTSGNLGTLKIQGAANGPYGQVNVTEVANDLTKALVVVQTAGGNSAERFTVFGNGNTNIAGKVKIGNVPTTGNTNLENNYSLYVEKGIIAESFKCALKTTSDWEDRVFEKEYNLLSLSDLERYIKENKHLPNIPSAHEMMANGLDVAKNEALLLQKIEELTLHIINQQKQIDALQNKINH